MSQLGSTRFLRLRGGCLGISRFPIRLLPMNMEPGRSVVGILRGHPQREVGKTSGRAIIRGLIGSSSVPSLTMSTAHAESFVSLRFAQPTTNQQRIH